MTRHSVLGLMVLSFTFGMGMAAPVLSIGLSVAGLGTLLAIPVSLALGLLISLYALEHNWFGEPY